MGLKKTVAECIPHKDPFVKPDYTEPDAQAIRAISRGEATPDQQKRGLNWLLWAFGTHDMSFRPGEPDVSNFAEGRRFAGIIIQYMLHSAETKTDPDKIATRNIIQGDERA